MSFIRRIPDATADILLGNGEEQITWLGRKMQKHCDIQMRPIAREPKKVFQSQIIIKIYICKYDTCKQRTCHFKPSSSDALILRKKIINGNLSSTFYIALSCKYQLNNACKSIKNLTIKCKLLHK